MGRETAAARRARTAPTARLATGRDWSGSAAEAAVGQLVHAAAAVDDATVRLVEALVRVRETGATDEVFGVEADVVLSQTCRMVGFERRTLLRAARTLVTMPALRQAFREGWIGWSAVRAIVTAVHRTTVAGRAQVDVLVGRVAHEYRDMEADALVQEVDWLVDQLVAQRAAETAAEPVVDPVTVLTQRPDGSGTLYAEYDAARFPLVAQAIASLANGRHPLRDQPDAVDAEDVDPAVADDLDDDALTDAHRHAAGVRRRNRARRGKALFELLTGCDHDTLDPLAPARAGGRPAVLVTCQVDTLLDGTTPGWVLNELGGRVRVTADVARRWVDAHGADTNVFLFDEVGEVVGHGRRQRHARGWLRDAVLARDLHDTAPCSTTPGMLCDVDHVEAWQDGGATAVDNLTVLSRRHNNAKSRGAWTLVRHPDGSRTWTAASGYRVRQPRPPHLRGLPRPTPPPNPPPDRPPTPPPPDGGPSP